MLSRLWVEYCELRERLMRAGEIPRDGSVQPTEEAPKADPEGERQVRRLRARTVAVAKRKSDAKD